MKYNTTTLTTQTAPPNLKQMLVSENVQNQLALALPKHMSAERMARVAITAMSKTPKLQQCTPASFMSCVLDLSAMGLEPDNRRAYLIPYGTTCTLIVSYMGLVELVKRNGDVAKIHCDVVHQNDEFEFNFGEIEKHKFSFTEDRGEPVAVYAMVQFKDGTKQCEVMTKAEVETIRQASQGKNQKPWKDHWGEMAKKTVFRRLTKWLTLSPEIRDSIDKIDENEFKNVTPATTTKPPLETPVDPFADLTLEESTTEKQD